MSGKKTECVMGKGYCSFAFQLLPGIFYVRELVLLSEVENYIKDLLVLLDIQ